jgi:light-independent protochlorophyllide reductase subunit N
VIKLDLANAAQRLQQNNPDGPRIFDYSGSGIETTFTQGEDSCLHNLVPLLPAADPAAGPELMVAGTLADIVEDQFTRLFEGLGIGPVRYFPPRSIADLPPVGAQTRVLLAQPYLGDTARALQARGATLLQAPYPLGAEGTLAWLQAAASAWDVPAATFEQVTRAPLDRARRAIAARATELAGRRVTFLPDSQLEVPLARFLSRECGAELVEVATPFHDQQLMAGEMPLLPDGARLTEGQDLDPQLARVAEDRPDLTVCGLGIANPLEAQGLRTKWSIELMFTPIQGFDQAGDLVGLFTRPLQRDALLEV